MKKYAQTIKSLLNEYKHAIITLILVAVISDIFFGSKSDLNTFIILGSSIFFFSFYKFNSKRIFILCFIPIGIIFFTFLFSSHPLVSEKAARWLFLLMGTGILQEFIIKR